MNRILFDSTLYIESLRRSDGTLLLARTYGESLMHLNSVVVEELYAGATDAKAEAAIERLHVSFQRVRRIVTPLHTDWVEAGRVLAKIGRKYGHETIGRSRLTNDALIAISASRQGVAVATLDIGDFSLIQEFHPFNLLAISFGPKTQ